MSKEERNRSVKLNLGLWPRSEQLKRSVLFITPSDTNICQVRMSVSFHFR